MNTAMLFRHMWTPALITTDAWYDAADSATITESSGSVSQWDDKSGNDYHVTQGTGSLQPTTNSRTQNGLNVIDFDGGDALQNTTANIAQQPNTIYVVGAYDSGSSARYLLDGSNTSGRQIVYFNGTSSVYLMYAGGAISGGTLVTDTKVFSCIFDGASSELFVDGTSEATGNAGTQDLDGITIGARFTEGDNFLNGMVAEIVVVDGAASTADRQKLEGYLAWKWGLESNLPSAHSYKDRPPYAGD